MLLIGDIGGTNTRLALFEYKDKLKIVKEHRFLSNNFSSLQSAINAFLKDEKVEIEAASFGVAGPVKEGQCKATNIPWIIDIKEISQNLKTPNAYLLNDLEANAYGLKVLNDDEVLILNEGDKSAKGNIALIAAGTGLGEAGLYWDGKKHRPFACEGGHTDFGPRDELEVQLFRYLQKKYGHVSYERLISGPGIYNLYRFLIDEKIVPVDETLENEIKDHYEPQIAITDKAVNKENKLCERVIDWFISLYGAEAGNAALKFFALGGVFIGGGIAPRIIDKLKDGVFMKAFVDKGRFSNMMMNIPLKIVLNDKAALLGAAQYAKLKITKVFNGE